MCHSYGHNIADCATMKYLNNLWKYNNTTRKYWGHQKGQVSKRKRNRVYITNTLNKSFAKEAIKIMKVDEDAFDDQKKREIKAAYKSLK